MTHGALFVPIILGSDKTTVSVATGHIAYWPLYASISNIHNNMRCAHGSGLVLVGFLSIPKILLCPSLHIASTDFVSSVDKAHTSDVDFCQFWQKLFHVSISYILQSFQPGEVTPEVFQCPDGQICSNTIQTKCPGGFYCPRGMNPLDLYNYVCPAGFYCNEATESNTVYNLQCTGVYFCPNGTRLYQAFRSANSSDKPYTRCPIATGTNSIEGKTSLMNCTMDVKYESHSI